MPIYDHGFFKILSRNDLGRTSHQGGIVIPKPLRDFLPPLPEGGHAPTTERWLTLDLYDGQTPVGLVESRYQSQTWDNTRPSETRLTRNLGPSLLKAAEVGDAVVLERQVDSVSRYRATLARQGSAEHAALLASGQRWGPVDDGRPPADLSVIDELANEIAEASSDPLTLFGEERLWSPFRRLVRDEAFRRLVLRAYDRLCAACGEGWVDPVDVPENDAPVEPEGAHIVPVSLRGVDDLRNGLCLCRSHHWAFDHRIIFVDSGQRWRVVDASKRVNRNGTLNEIDGALLHPPQTGFPPPSTEALEWHREAALNR